MLFDLHEIFQIGKSPEMESRLVGVGSRRGRENRGNCRLDMGLVSLWSYENIFESNKVSSFIPYLYETLRSAHFPREWWWTRVNPVLRGRAER